MLNFDKVQSVLAHEEVALKKYEDIYETSHYLALCDAENALFNGRRFRFFEPEKIDALIVKAELTYEDAYYAHRCLPYDEFCVLTPHCCAFYHATPHIDGYQWIASVVVRDTSITEKNKYFFIPAFCFLDNGKFEIHAPIDVARDKNLQPHWELACNVVKQFLMSCLQGISLCRSNFIDKPIAKKIQKKRAKNGKYPNFEYKICVLEPKALATLSKEKQYEITNRLSPRIHERRGHDRHYKNGNVVHIPKTIVGLKGNAQGVIYKNYDVKPK